MGYWKSKVLPKIKKVFEKNSGTKKAAAAEASKLFDDSKEEYNKSFDEKKTELQTKVIEIYEASSTEIKSLVKERNEAGLKKSSTVTAVNKFLEELVKIDFPGSKAASEASSKFGPALASGPVFFVFEKVSTFIVTEEKEKVEAAPPTETKAEEEASTVTEREIVVEEEKKEEEKPQVVEPTEKIEAEPPKVEEKPAEPATKEEEKSASTAKEEEKSAPTAKEEEKPAEPAAAVEQAAEPPKP
ncbi:DREPP family [Sesbania bispinosa]|nr:DREPP family [Sesbania bispinosa]